MFQLGMSRYAKISNSRNFEMTFCRIAVVVPATPKGPLAVLNNSWDLDNTRWTGTERTNNRVKSKLKVSKAKFDWTIDFLQAAHLNADDSLLQRHRIFGIRSPKPLGIITFEDIIDTILQKTSRDENDFFDRNTSNPPTKGKKVGDYSPRPVIGGIAPNSTIPRRHSKGHLSFNKSNQRNVLRKRKPSIDVNPANLDGADERNQENRSIGSMRQKKTRKDFVESSYTQNSRGGFHDANQSDSSIYPAVMLSMMTSEDMAELANTSSSDCPGNPYSPTKSASLPSRKNRSPSASKTQKTSMRHVSAAPILPTVRRVTPFSRNTTSYERSEEAKQAACNLVMPAPSMSPAPAPRSPRPYFNHNASGIDIEDEIWREHFARDGCENSSELATLNSFDGEEDNDEGNSALYDAFPVPANGQQRPESLFSRDLSTIKEEKEKMPYEGFPPELLESKDENRIMNYDSKTMPRMAGSSELDTTVREESFHDDRSMLPSQKKTMEGEGIVIGARSSSLWW
jgi:metal transporter CNNM